MKPRVGLIGARRRRQGLGPFVARDLVSAGAVVPCFLSSSTETIASGRAALLEHAGTEANGYTELDEMVEKERLDADIPLIDVVIGRAEGRDVRMTMVDGRIVYRDGVLRSMDEAELRARALTAVEASHRTMTPKEQRNLQRLRKHIAAHYRDMTAAQRPRR